jgi:hypothetical protein
MRLLSRALPVFTALALGCGDEETPPPITTTQEPDLAVDTVDGAYVASVATALVADTLTTTMSGEGAAMTAAAGAGMFLQPAGCVRAPANGNVVTYTLTNCAGPYGFAQASGTLRATITSNGPGLGFTVVLAGSLNANRGRWTIDASANVAGGNTSAERRAAVTSRVSGTGAHGRTLTHAGLFNIAWTSQSIDLNGTWETHVANLTFNTTVMNFRRRETMCPESGGTVRLSTPDGRSVTVTFTATATATVSGSGGRTGTVPLYCGM